MGELLLCRKPIASMPYYIESAALNIYSLEELCYYIRNHIYLIDRELMNEELIGWIERELGDAQTAEKLQNIKRKGGSAYHFTMTLLIESGYCSKQELLEADGILKELQNKSEPECRKLRADRYVEAGKYAKAAGEYIRLTEMESFQEESETFAGNVWHNLGCAYAGMFFFEEAADCFDKAYQKNHNTESLEHKELCRTLMEDGVPKEFAVMDQKYQNTKKQAESLKNLGDTEGYYEVYGALVEEWKQQYTQNSRV